MPRHIVLQSILLAEHIYMDTATNKRVMTGTFNSISVSQFPTEIGGMTSLYMCLRDIEPSDAITIEFVDSSANSVLFEQGAIKIGGLPEPVEIVTTIDKIKITHAGAYTFDVFTNGNRFLGAFRLTV
ncbi:MAG: hypothetical protein LBU65_12660, partial [Planctomycetaceae bacterium]|nr:hypothetical protein [Planctomycetaceae bacterium]